MDPIDVTSLPPAAQKVLGAGAPVPAKMLAAKGVIPGVPPAHALSVVVALAHGDNAMVAATAKQTLDAVPPPMLQAALGADLPGPVIDALAERYGKDRDVLPRLIGMAHIDPDTIAKLARGADEAAGEIIATNEVLLLKVPKAIEELYMNKRVRMSTADRLIDLAVRNQLELDFPAFKLAAAAIQNELVPEPTEERSYDDDLFDETGALAEKIPADAEHEDVCEEDDEGQEQVAQKFLPLFTQIQQMTVTQKIRRAMLGTGAERMLLVRDTNRLVAEAAARSPRLTENEAARISTSRAVSDDVLRIIAMNRDFTRSYQVKLNLVSNPRTPLTFAARLIPHLRQNDLRSLARSKNIPGPIVRAVRQQLARKQRNG